MDGRREVERAGSGNRNPRIPALTRQFILFERKLITNSEFLQELVACGVRFSENWMKRAKFRSSSVVSGVEVRFERRGKPRKACRPRVQSTINPRQRIKKWRIPTDVSETFGPMGTRPKPAASALRALKRVPAVERSAHVPRRRNSRSSLVKARTITPTFCARARRPPSPAPCVCCLAAASRSDANGCGAPAYDAGRTLLAQPSARTRAEAEMRSRPQARSKR
jgi:hypothetical protein